MAVTGDFGYRTCDYFIRQHRTAFGRVIFEKSHREKSALGLGFALFGHFKDEWKLEYRPFLQFVYQKKFMPLDLGVRIRNEFRFLDDGRNFRNRTRLQCSARLLKKNRWFDPVFSVETFITPGHAKLMEQRYTVGITSSASPDLTSHLFYTLQRQSSLDLNQNIAGLQLQIFLR